MSTVNTTTAPGSVSVSGSILSQFPAEYFEADRARAVSVETGLSIWTTETGLGILSKYNGFCIPDDATKVSDVQMYGEMNESAETLMSKLQQFQRGSSEDGDQVLVGKIQLAIPLLAARIPMQSFINRLVSMYGTKQAHTRPIANSKESDELRRIITIVQVIDGPETAICVDKEVVDRIVECALACGVPKGVDERLWRHILEHDLKVAF